MKSQHMLNRAAGLCYSSGIGLGGSGMGLLQGLMLMLMWFNGGWEGLGWVDTP